MNEDKGNVDMNFKTDRYIKGLFSVNVLLTLVFTFLYYLIKDSMPFFYVIALFLIELLCIAWGVISQGFKIKISNNEKILLVVILCTQIGACLVSTLRFGYTIFDIHKIALYVGMLAACFFVARRNTISSKTFNKIINIVLSIGVFACLFNLYVNRQYFQGFNLAIIMFYTWNFSSFFFTRATYGVFVAICAIMALYRAEKERNKMYLLLYIFFVLNVLITAARMEMLAVIISSYIYMMHSKKYRRVIIPVGLVILFFLIIYGISNINMIITEFTDKYFIFFKSHGGLSDDITTGRIGLWEKAFEYTDIYSFFFGHGLGNKDEIMIRDNIQVLGETLNSFHSGYVDLYFEMGIFGVCVTVFIALNILVKTKKMYSLKLRNLVWGLMSIWFLVNLADSNLLPFTTDMFSPISCFFFFALPICMINSNESLKND